jgi:hypothetical protein
LRAVLRTLAEAPRFLRGDVDLDGGITVTDAVLVLLHLFRGREIQCQDAADANDSGDLNLTDAVVILRYLFASGMEPATPFPEPGPDPMLDGLGCAMGLE